MDFNVDKDDLSLAHVVLYIFISFLVITALGLAFYVTCGRKYRLNWFEKNLLEAAQESEDVEQCAENIADDISECSQFYAGRLGSMTPTSLYNEDPAFWVPPARPVQQQISTSADESPPPTPTSPTGSLRSNTLSIGSQSSLALARSGRSKVISMNTKLDHTKIDTSLYRTVSQQSESSVGIVEHRYGNLHVSLNYDAMNGILSVHLIEARNLQSRELNGSADPYAQVRLLPEKKNFYQTKILKKTLNPVFNEDFVFEESPQELEKRTLEILLYDFDAFSRHICLGGTKIPLKELDLTDKQEIWRTLTACSEQDMKADLGDLMVSLAYLPSAERLTVVVVKARNLRVVDDTRNASDPYVKVSVFLGEKKLKKRKTGVQRNTINPIYNEALTFDINKDMLPKVLIEICVIHDNLLGPNEVLGCILIGNSPSVRVEEKILFKDICRNNKNATAQWISLQEASIDTTMRSNSIVEK